jgi:hypothetical protein
MAESARFLCHLRRPAHIKGGGPGRFICHRTRFYEGWYAGPGSRPGHPQLIAAGTFTVGPAATATVQMWSAADPIPSPPCKSPPKPQATAARAGESSSPAPSPANPDSGSHTTSGMPAQFAQCPGMSQATTSTKMTCIRPALWLAEMEERSAEMPEPPQLRRITMDAFDLYVPEPAATPEPKPSPASKASRWWHLHWTNPLLSVVTALGAAAVTAAAIIGIQVSQVAAPAVAASFNLHAQPGQSGSATAVARHVNGGWEIQLTVKHLKDPDPGQFYECWYAGPHNRPGHPELITAGTFAGSNGTFSMWSAADPAKFKIMQITAEQPGDASQHGKVILSGIAQT